NRGFTDPVPAKHEQRYREKGIDTYHGRARFSGPNTIEVGDESLDAKHVLIASGAEPIKLGIAGKECLTTSEEFLALPELPKRIALVGGGYIAAEFSHIAARAGAQVTVLQRGPRLLDGFDSDLVGWLMESFVTIGVDVRLQATVTAIEKTDSGYRVHCTSHGRASTVDADLVVHAAGRAPVLESLDLAAAGLARKHGRLVLNEYLQSVSNPSVFAAGDAAQAGPPLTPVSSHDAKVVVANLLHGNHRRPDYRGVPSVVFTIPPMATVGLTEAEAREQGLNFRVKAQRASDWFTARQAAEPVYGFSVLVDEDSDQILGAHLVGPHADEVINLFALAIRHGLTAANLKSTMFAYPTGASDIGSMV
ncbi:MAG: NAD(P)/FAD-dependent oxidoreductase, partial [Xanthomonadales bacterium]|nr:NAD(P)/FAD-dependent oxidoreductase [Xanthomonadales bacterium]